MSMPPEETTTPDIPQPTPESPESAIKTPAPVIEPMTPPQEVSPEATPPEVSPIPAEVNPVPDSTSSPQAETAPASAEATAGTQPVIPTAQIPPNEPIPVQPEPIVPTSAPAVTQPEPQPTASVPVILAPVHAIRDLLAKARVSIQDRKRKKRDKIMEVFTKKNKITNDEVEKLLHVSDATATRYLSALVKEGKIQKVGRTGTAVVYTKV